MHTQARGETVYVYIRNEDAAKAANIDNVLKEATKWKTLVTEASRGWRQVGAAGGEAGTPPR